jgi:hypothetical protein
MARVQEKADEDSPIGATMPYQKEDQMYPAVVKWLRDFLEQRHDKNEVFVYDTHDVYLSNFLPSKGFTNRDFPAYEIKVDVTGVIRGPKSDNLAFVECKLNRIRLIDVAQIIGYSRVANPEYSFIISPEGPNDAVYRLLVTFNKLRVLEYNEGRSVVLAKWDESKGCIDFMSLLPQGSVK